MHKSFIFAYCLLAMIAGASGVAVAVFATIATEQAMAQVDIGTTDNEGFALITEWFQAFVDFMEGPMGVAIVVLSLVIAVATWVFAPREGLFGPVIRVAVGALVLLNIGTWITTWGFGGG